MFLFSDRIYVNQRKKKKKKKKEYMSINISKNFVNKIIQLKPNVTLHLYIKYFPYTFSCD